MTGQVLRLLRDELAAAVAPEPILVTLASLVSTGVLVGFREEPPHIVVWGNLTAVEVALENLEAQNIETPPQEPSTKETEAAAKFARIQAWYRLADARAEYFRIARQYTRTKSFVRLPAVNREIWRLHAQGMKYPEICHRLKVSPAQVRAALRGARLAAGLPASTMTLPARGGGRPALYQGCSEEGCKSPHHARGLCVAHAAKRWRAGKNGNMAHGG